MRKAFFSPSTVLTFISGDDPAIGVPDNERADVIAQYAKTLDQRLLKLRSDMEPCKFFVRVLSAEQKSVIQAMFTDELQELATSLRAETGRALLRDLLDRNVVGMRNFCLIQGVNEIGELDIKRYDIEINQPIPTDVREAMLGDAGLSINLLLFLLSAGSLSESEKKP